MEKKFRILFQTWFSNRKKSDLNRTLRQELNSDSNSCGVLLIAAMAAYVHSLPRPSMRNDAFDIAFSFFERKKDFRGENAESEVPSSENWKSKDHINIYLSAKFLIDGLENNPASFPFYAEVLPKGIRSNYFYITDTSYYSWR